MSFFQYHYVNPCLRSPFLLFDRLGQAYGRESSMSSAQKAVKILEDAREAGRSPFLAVDGGLI